LVSMTAPRPVGSDRYRVIVRMRPASTVLARTVRSDDQSRVFGRSRLVRRRPQFRGAVRAVVTVAVVATVCVAVAVWLLLGVIVPAGVHLVAHYGIAALGVAVIVVALGAVGVGAAVHHCPGCRHR